MVKNNKDENITESMTGKWEFNEEVSQVFDEMLERSIPSYNRMRFLVKEIVIHHIRANNLQYTDILDLGSSTGEQLRMLIDELPSNNFLGLECSQPMLHEATNNFKDYNNIGFLDFDLTQKDLPLTDCGCILSILTLQFIPIEYRQRIIKNIYNHLHNKGVFIFVEKIIGDNYNYTGLYEKLYYDMKQINGYSINEIRDKKLKLEGVLVPVTNQFNLDLLKQAGFSKIDIFWKDLNFIGYIVMK